jgi:hypothetical protein
MTRLSVKLDCFPSSDEQRNEMQFRAEVPLATLASVRMAEIEIDFEAERIFCTSGKSVKCCFNSCNQVCDVFVSFHHLGTLAR